MKASSDVLPAYSRRAGDEPAPARDTCDNCDKVPNKSETYNYLKTRETSNKK